MSLFTVIIRFHEKKLLFSSSDPNQLGVNSPGLARRNRGGSLSGELGGEITNSPAGTRRRFVLFTFFTYICCLFTFLSAFLFTFFQAFKNSFWRRRQIIQFFANRWFGPIQGTKYFSGQFSCRISTKLWYLLYMFTVICLLLVTVGQKI